MHARLDDLRNCDHIRRHCIGYREHNRRARPRVSANGPSKAEFSVFPGWLPVIFQKPPSAGIGVQSFAVATAAVTIGDSRVFLSFSSLFFRDFCFFFLFFFFVCFSVSPGAGVVPVVSQFRRAGVKNERAEFMGGLCAPFYTTKPFMRLRRTICGFCPTLGQLRLKNIDGRRPRDCKGTMRVLNF